jgi:hypothetical protein
MTPSLRRLLDACGRSLGPALLVLGALAAARSAAAQSCPGPFPEIEPNGTVGTATPVTPAALVVGAPGEIAPAGDVDYFQLAAPAGARLWLSVDTGGPQQPGATSRDSVLQVFAPDGTTLLEEDDDDGTGNGQSTVITSAEASVIAGLPLPTAGTYFVRVSAKSAADVIAPYVLLVGLTTSATAEVEPNDTQGQPNPLSSGAVVGALASPSYVDWYLAGVLAFDRVFVAVDGDPERDGTSTDVALDFQIFAPPPMPQVDSSTGQGAPPPAAEGVVLPFLSLIRVSGPAAGTYAITAFYTGLPCALPVTLRTFAVE